MPAITITWRDENYGACNGAISAFRIYDIGERSLSEKKVIELAASHSGFEWNDRRGSWICYKTDGHREFVFLLSSMLHGFEIKHAGRWRAEAFA